MPKHHANSRRNSIHVVYTSGNSKGRVARLPWSDAQDLLERGSALAVSNTLAQAYRAGIDILGLPRAKNSKQMAETLQSLRVKASDGELKQRIKAAKQAAAKPEKGDDQGDDQGDGKRKRKRRKAASR